MTDQDRPLFDQAFTRLALTFRLRGKPGEQQALGGTYFKLLQGWTLEQVLAAAKACLEKSRVFPKPVDWLTALPPRTSVPEDLRWMGADEVREYARAEALHYEDLPCACVLCEAANVSTKPIRFVPDFDSDFDSETVSEMRAFHPQKNAAVTLGHWAHGEELRRWYVARERFYSLAAPRLVRVARVPLQLVAAGEREPGEEG